MATLGSDGFLKKSQPNPDQGCPVPYQLWLWQTKGTYIPFPQVRPQLTLWSFSHLHQQNHWYRSKQVCVRLACLGRGLGFGLPARGQSHPTPGSGPPTGLLPPVPILLPSILTSPPPCTGQSRLEQTHCAGSAWRLDAAFMGQCPSLRRSRQLPRQDKCALCTFCNSTGPAQVTCLPYGMLKCLHKAFWNCWVAHCKTVYRKWHQMVRASEIPFHQPTRRHELWSPVCIWNTFNLCGCRNLIYGWQRFNLVKLLFKERVPNVGRLGCARLCLYCDVEWA